MRRILSRPTISNSSRFEVRSTRGTRRIPAEGLYLGPYATVLEPDELLTSVYFPEWPSDTISLFHEVAMRPGDFALVGLSGAAVVKDQRIVRAGLAWFGMGPTPMKARQVEAALLGQSIDKLDTRALAELAIADTTPFDDHHATAEYRRTVGARMFARILNERVSSRKAA